MKFFFLFMYPLFTFSQQSLDAFAIEKKWAKELSQKKLNTYLKLKVSDTRQYLNNKIELSKIIAVFNEKLANSGYNVIDDINDTFKLITPVIINLNIDYLNYVGSDISKNLFAKGIIEVVLEKGDFLKENMTLKVADDVFISNFSLKTLFNPKNQKIKDNYEKDLVIKLVNQLYNDISNMLNSSSLHLFEVVSFGKAIILKNDVKKAKSDAISNALITASSNVFGKKIQSEITMVDLGNVTEVIKELINCTVIEYKQIENFETISKDKYACVLIKSILKL